MFLLVPVAQASAFTYNVDIEGTGSGTVTGFGFFEPGEVFGEFNCAGPPPSGECEVSFGTSGFGEVTATPDPGSEFVGWTVSGGLVLEKCGTDPTCAVSTEEEDVTLTAVFAEETSGFTYDIDIEGTGSGTVAGFAVFEPEEIFGEFNCAGPPPSGECEVGFEEGGGFGEVTATPGAGSEFVEWIVSGGTVEGNCGTNPTCTVSTVEEDVTLTAVFDEESTASFTYDIDIEGTGSGTVAGFGFFEPGEIFGEFNCSGPPPSGECGVNFGASGFGEVTATPDPGSQFVEWIVSGGLVLEKCGADPTCAVSTEEENVTLTAVFDELPPLPAVEGISPTEGSTAGGNQIVITGSNLANATKIEFGSTVVNAPFIENTAGTIKLKAPGHSAGTVDVVVTTASGPSPVTGSDKYTYIATPAVLSLNPSNGPTTGGNQVEIVGKNLAEATKVEFGSAVVNAPFTENTDSVIKLNAPAHAAGTVDVRVTTLVGGISGRFEQDEYTYQVPTQTLTVGKAGSGSGTVTSAPAGINCGLACAAAFSEGAVVTLSAAASSGSTFAGWSGGGCSGTGSCVVTMSAAKAVTATFTANPAPPLPPPAPGTLEVAANAAFSGGKAALKATCNGGSACDSTLTLKAKINGKNRTIGTASFSVGAGKNKTLNVRITNQAAKTRLQEGKPVHATVSGQDVKQSKVKIKKANK